MDKLQPTTVYISRHGESEGNATGVLQGHLDLPLTPLGEEQAKQLADELHHVHFDAVFSSDLLRAKRTAELVALEHQLVITTTETLRERYFGELQGKGKKDFTQEISKLFDDWNALSDEEWLSHQIAEGVETGSEMVARMEHFLRELATGYPGKTVLVVCHGDLMRTLLVHLGWGTHIELRGKTIGNAAYIKLETNGEDFNVRETKGIKKNEGDEYTWGTQPESK